MFGLNRDLRPETKDPEIICDAWSRNTYKLC